MYFRQIKFLTRLAVLSLCALAFAFGQTQDNSQNSLLKGSYRFRHIAVQLVDENFNPTDITASYGTITFDGAGHYTILGTSIDPSVSAGAPTVLSVTAAYAIGSNGTGYLTNPLYSTDPNAFIYGAVSQGVFTGSSTESQNDGNTLNDLFIAIPVASTPPTTASFTSSYQTGLIDFAGADSAAIKNALFALSPNGSGAFGAIALSGQASNQSAISLAQSITGATYNFNSDGSATLTVPLPTGQTATNALFTGTKTIFESADGNFILGWTSSGYDIFFGVKTLAVTGTNSLVGGLYFTGAVEDSPASGSYGTDSYYGSTKFFGDANGDGIVHQRVNVPSGLSFDYGTDDILTLSANGTAGPDYNGYDYIFGDGGKAFVAIGTDGFFSLVVGMQAPTFTGTGVFLNPTGIVNAANYQPITASIAPGELITLFGSGLASGTVTAPAGAFPTTLGGVSVTIDNILCPIYYVSAGQMAVIVPYEVASNQTGLANIQVTNNKAASNVVQMYLTDAAPGSFSQNLEGIGLGAAEHAATGLPLTSSSPAQPGEYVSLYLTGLGTVTPTIPDGAPGPFPPSPLSYSDLYNAGNLSVNFIDYNNGADITGTIQYAGLAPYFTGLYQMNVQIPTSGLEGPDVYVEFITDAAQVNQIQIPYAGTTSRLDAPSARPVGRKALAIKSRRSLRSKPSEHHMQRGQPEAAPNN